MNLLLQIYFYTYTCVHTHIYAYTDAIFQLIPFLEYCFQWLSYVYVLRTITFRNMFVREKNLLFCLKYFLKMITKDRQYLSLAFIQIVGLRLFIICLTSDQWSLVCFVTYIKIIDIFIWNMRLENPQVPPFIYPVLPINNSIRNSIYFYCSRGLKALQRLPV